MPSVATIPPVTRFDALGIELTQTPIFVSDSLLGQVLDAAANAGISLSVQSASTPTVLVAQAYYNPAIGAPTGGTFELGDVCSDSNSSWWQCVLAGTPGTWTQLGTDIAALGYVSTALLAVPSGVATLDSGGAVAEPPQAHTHTIPVLDSGGTSYDVASFNLVNSSLLTYHSTTKQLDVNLTSAAIKLRVGSSDATASITNSITTQSVTSLTTATLAANSQWDMYAFLPVTSTTAAGARIGVTGPTGSNMTGNFFGPQVSQTTFDSTTMRFATLNIPNNGPQQFGGFGDSALAMTTVRFEGSIIIGSTAGTVQVRLAQATATSGVTTSLSPFHAKFFLFPA